MDGRPPSSAGNRPGSGLRPITTTRNAALGLSSRSNIPGTASRLITSSNNRPGTRSGVAQGIGVMSHISVVDRPMSQQGLVTPRTGVRIPQRQIQDKSYFMGLLRSKINELTNEIARIVRETDTLTKEQSTYITYEKKAEAQACELKKLQGLLADYNLLVDKINTDAEMADVQEEFKELMVQNEREAENIVQLFEERQAKEALVNQLEMEIKKEQSVADNLISTMSSDLQKKSGNLKRQSSNLHATLEQLQQQLDSWLCQKNALEEELQLSQVKQEAVVLYGKLREIEEKRDSLLDENSGKNEPAQEKESLLQQVKENNAELGSIERQTNETKEKITKIKSELLDLEQEIEDHHGERFLKYRELKKREETMDTFLATFTESKSSEVEKKMQLEASIVTLLEKLSRNLSHFHHLPSPQELSTLKDDLSFKEGEMEKSRVTMVSLNQEQKKLTIDLSKIEQLETKIQQELETLQQKISAMEKEMVTYSNLEKLKISADEKKILLSEEEAILSKQQLILKKMFSELNAKHENLKAKLSDNETFTQLNNLERRWQHLEQSNFAINEFVAAKMAETNYKSTKQLTEKMISELNKHIQSSLSQR